jgi:hypothetical protein
MKRREFTTSVASVTGLSALLGPMAFASVDRLGKLTTAVSPMARSRFEARLGQTFTTRCDIVDSNLRLIDVKSAVRGRGQEQFNVWFEAPAGEKLPEGIYFLETGGKTEYGLHLMPGRTIAGRQRMIAVINLQTAA